MIQDTDSRKETGGASSNRTVAEQKDGGSWIQARYVVVFAAFLLNATFYLTRVILSVAVVAIALDPEKGGENGTARADAPHYPWDARARSTLLSSFFWGATATMMASNYVIKLAGSRLLVFGMLLATTLANALFVPAASLGWEWAAASRVLLGMSQGGLMPACHSLLARWSPPHERGRLTVYTYTGIYLGTILGLAGAGVISDTIGWPWVFHISSMLALVMAFVWLLLVADSPEQHRMASKREQTYIAMSIADADGNRVEKQKELRTPWRGIFTSSPFWALLIVQCAHGFGFWTLLTGIPSYMNGVLSFDLTKDGLLSSLPYLANWSGGLLFSWIADLLLRRKIWSVGTSRKFFNSIGHYGAALMLVILGYAASEPTVAVALLTIAVGLNSGALVGYTPNHIDLSPNFAGILVGMANSAASMMGILAPLAIGLVVTDNESVSQWRTVFLIAAGCYTLANSTFVLFGSATVQPWNDPQWTRASQESDTESSNESPQMEQSKLKN